MSGGEGSGPGAGRTRRNGAKGKGCAGKWKGLFRVRGKRGGVSLERGELRASQCR